MDYSETYTEGWCYMHVEVEGDTVRLKLGVVASDHVFDVTLHREADGSYTIVSMVELKNV